jgi:cytoskeleton protein RodZ
MTERTSHEARESQKRPSHQRRLHLREVTAEASNYDGLGADLKAARVRNGLDLAEVAEELRIRRVHIHAMEEGHFDDLPAPVYAVGFVRSYADYLGLDGEIAVEAFKQEASGLKGETKLVFPSPMPESRVPTGWLIAVSLVLAGMIYAGWYYAEMNGRLATGRVPPLPERLAALAPTPSADEPAVENSSVSESLSVAVGEAALATDPGVPDPVAADEPAADDDPVAADQPTATDEDDARVSSVITVPSQTTPGITSFGSMERTLQPPAESDSASGIASATSDTRAPPELATPPPATRANTSSAEMAPGPSQHEVPVDAVSDDPFRVNLEILSSVTKAMIKPEPEPAVEDETQVASESAALGLNLSERQPRIYGEGNWEARVVIKAKTESWIQVLSRDGDLLLTRVLRPGDQYLVPNRSNLFLMTGNAGGIEIIVDGKSVPAIGRPGVVRDNVALVPERLIAGTAVDQ